MYNFALRCFVQIDHRDLLKEDYDECIDTSFFEPDYTVAAATAELIWEGSWTMIELLRGVSDPMRVFLLLPLPSSPSLSLSLSLSLLDRKG